MTESIQGAANDLAQGRVDDPVTLGNIVNESAQGKQVDDWISLGLQYDQVNSGEKSQWLSHSRENCWWPSSPREHSQWPSQPRKTVNDRICLGNTVNDYISPGKTVDNWVNLGRVNELVSPGKSWWPSHSREHSQWVSLEKTVNDWISQAKQLMTESVQGTQLITELVQGIQLMTKLVQGKQSMNRWHSDQFSREKSQWLNHFKENSDHKMTGSDSLSPGKAVDDRVTLGSLIDYWVTPGQTANNQVSWENTAHDRAGPGETINDQMTEWSLIPGKTGDDWIRPKKTADDEMTQEVVLLVQGNRLWLRYINIEDTIEWGDRAHTSVEQTPCQDVEHRPQERVPVSMFSQPLHPPQPRQHWSNTFSNKYLFCLF